MADGKPAPTREQAEAAQRWVVGVSDLLQTSMKVGLGAAPSSLGPMSLGMLGASLFARALLETAVAHPEWAVGWLRAWAANGTREGMIDATLTLLPCPERQVVGADDE